VGRDEVSHRFKHFVRTHRGGYHAVMAAAYMPATIVVGALYLLGVISEAAMVLVVLAMTGETGQTSHLSGWAADDAAPSVDELEADEAS
jgi:hypothetical protein